MSDSSTSAPSKVCVGCGADLAGHRRIKDELGQYWCLQCAKKAESNHATGPTRVKCPDCGREVPEDSLIPHGLTQVCSRCYRERTAEKKSWNAKSNRIAGAYRKEEIRNLKILGAVAGGLLLIAMWNLNLFSFLTSSDSQLTNAFSGAIMLLVVFLLLLVGIIFWVKKRL